MRQIFNVIFTALAIVSFSLSIIYIANGIDSDVSIFYLLEQLSHVPNQFIFNLDPSTITLPFIRVLYNLFLGPLNVLYSVISWLIFILKTFIWVPLFG